MPQGLSRVVGSNYTTFNYNGQPIQLLDAVRDSGQPAFSDAGQGYQFVHPLGNRHPKEIATSRVLQGGTLQLTIRETWLSPIWHQLAGLANSYSIVDIYEYLSQTPEYVTCNLIITPPRGVVGRQVRGKAYQNCVVVGIDDSETVTVGAMTAPKGITIAYTHSVPFKLSS